MPTFTENALADHRADNEQAENKLRPNLWVGAGRASTACGLALLLGWAINVSTARAQSALAQQYGSQQEAAQQSSGQQGATGQKQEPKDQTNGQKASNKPAATKSSAQPKNTVKTTAKKTAAAPGSAVNTKTEPAKATDSKSAAAKPVKRASKKAPAKPLVFLNEGSAAKTAADASSTEPGNKGGGKSQNNALVKAFEQDCPGVMLTPSKAKAGYDVMLEPVPGGKGVKSGFGLAGVVHKTNRIEVTSKTGKELFSETGHSTTQLVKDACSAIAAPEMKLAKN